MKLKLTLSMKAFILSTALLLAFFLTAEAANPCDCNDPDYDPLLCAALNPLIPECQDGNSFTDCAGCFQKVTGGGIPTNNGAVSESVPVGDHLWLLILIGMGLSYAYSRKEV